MKKESPFAQVENIPGFLFIRTNSGGFWTEPPEHNHLSRNRKTLVNHTDFFWHVDVVRVFR